MSLVFFHDSQLQKHESIGTIRWIFGETPSQSLCDMFVSLCTARDLKSSWCAVTQRKGHASRKIFRSFKQLYISDLWCMRNYSNYSERVCLWQWLFTLASHYVTSAYPRGAVIARQEIHAWQLFETTMEGKLRLIITTYNLYDSTWTGWAGKFFRCYHIVYSCLVNKDSMTYHDSLEFVRIFFSMLSRSDKESWL